MTAASLMPGSSAPAGPERRSLAIAIVVSVAAHAVLTLVPLAAGNDAMKALTRATSAAAAITAVLLPARVEAPDRDPAPAPPQPTLVTAPPTAASPATVPTRVGDPRPAAPAADRGPEAAPALATRVDRAPPRPVEGRVLIEDLGAIDAVGTGSANDDAIAPFRSSGADTPPRLPETFLVGYPDLAFDSVVEGTQRVLVLVNVEGSVDFVVFEQEHPWFAPTIEAALRGAQLTPAQRKGEPVPGWLALEFEFQIVGGGPEVAAMRENAAVRVTP